MKHQQIIDLAREAGLSFVPEINSPLVKIVQKAVAMEREACANIAEQHEEGPGCADAIRARGQA